MMDIYKGLEDGKTCVVINGNMTEAEAIKTANRHFKTKKENLKAYFGYVKDEKLYDKKIKGSLKAWVVIRK
jgi:hypothetical protein